MGAACARQPPHQSRPPSPRPHGRSEPRNILRIISGERIGTVFHPVPSPVRGRKRWILSMPVRGEVWLDAGAERAVRDRKKSLFSAGVRSASGDFHAQDAVRLCDTEGREFARGLINYSHDEVLRIKGLPSSRIAAALGYSGQDEVVHRANLCLLTPGHDDSGAFAGVGGTRGGVGSGRHGRWRARAGARGALVAPRATCPVRSPWPCARPRHAPARHADHDDLHPHDSPDSSAPPSRSTTPGVHPMLVAAGISPGASPPPPTRSPAGGSSPPQQQQQQQPQQQQQQQQQQPQQQQQQQHDAPNDEVAARLALLQSR